MLSEKCFVVFNVFSFPAGVYVWTLNLIVSIPDHPFLTLTSYQIASEHRISFLWRHKQPIYFFRPQRAGPPKPRAKSFVCKRFRVIWQKTNIPYIVIFNCIYVAVDEAGSYDSSPAIGGHV